MLCALNAALTKHLMGTHGNRVDCSSRPKYKSILRPTTEHAESFYFMYSIHIILILELVNDSLQSSVLLIMQKINNKMLFTL